LHIATSSRMNSCHLLPSFLALEKRERERDLETGEIFWDIESIASPSLSNDGRAGPDPFINHAGTPAGPREPGVHKKTEVTTCHVPEDPASPAPVEGYVVAFVTF
jgi:hypothetical protein